MMGADLVTISHVSGSHQAGRIFHEEIIFTMLVPRCRRGGAMCFACTEAVGSSCSKWWLTLHEEDALCMRLHEHVPVCTQKQPFKRERCSLMDGHGWPRVRPQ